MKIYFQYIAKPIVNRNIEQDIEDRQKAQYFLDLTNIKLMSKKNPANQLQIGCKYFEQSNCSRAVLKKTRT